MLLDGNHIHAKDIDIYNVGNLIYWTESSNNTICLAELTEDGTGRPKGCLKINENAQIIPDRIAIHQKMGTIYFSNNCKVDVSLLLILSYYKYIILCRYSAEPKKLNPLPK